MSDEAHSIKYRDKQYPALLREIPHPPQELWIWGSLPKTKHWLGIVGTRKCTAYGKEAINAIVSDLASYDFTIVSGLAMGIDTAAHESALQNGLPTVAVLGSGFAKNVLHPARNYVLAERITKNNGAVISEYPPTTQAASWNFPARNRIISGLSHAILVVEAPEKSGALITAKFALDQNRDVLAIPGSLFFPQSVGSNTLIQQGALLVQNADDILRIYNIETKNKTPKENKTYSNEELVILNLLSEPMDINAIIRKSRYSAGQTQTIVSMLEIHGIIKKMGSEYTKAL